MMILHDNGGLRMIANLLLLVLFLDGLKRIQRYTDVACCLAAILPSAAGMLLVVRLEVSLIWGSLLVLTMILSAMIHSDCQFAAAALQDRGGKTGHEDCDH